MNQARIMEPRPLTTWEQKERDGLLAHETDEWREKRLIAEDPETTADALEKLMDAIYKAYNMIDLDEDGSAGRAARLSACLLAEALAAHANTAPKTLLSLLYLPAPFALFCPRGFCRNPAASLLCLETPDFWERLVDLEYTSGETVLREAGLPLPVIVQLSKSVEKSVAQSARLHVTLAGEITTPSDGQRELTDFWRAFCLEESQIPRLDAKRFSGHEWYTEMVEHGLAPAWALGKGVAMPRAWPQTPLPWDRSPLSPSRQATAERIDRAWSPETTAEVLVQLAREPQSKASAFVRRLVCRHPNAPPDIQTHARHGFLASVERSCFFSNFDYPKTATYPDGLAYNRTKFVVFVANLHGAFPLSKVYEMAQDAGWMERLNAALSLPRTASPFPDDPWNRTPLDLLEHLAHDGNIFVRWAAQTRLADSDFVFTWADE